MKKADLESIKVIVKACLVAGEHLRIIINPNPEGKYHILAQGGGDVMLKSHKAACEWASEYFSIASKIKQP